MKRTQGQLVENVKRFFASDGTPLARLDAATQREAVGYGVALGLSEYRAAKEFGMTVEQVRELTKDLDTVRCQG